MTVQHSDSVRNARLDALETAIGTAPHLRLYTGAQPANCAAVASGTLLIDITLPSDWLDNAAGASKVLAGVWSGAGSADGDAGHYRVMNTAGTVCHEQGSVSNTAGTGDLKLDNISVADQQVFEINTWSYTEGNA